MEAQHTCEKCGKEFSSERYLKQHLNKRIPCDKDHICNKCSKEFTTAQALRIHKNRKNPCIPDKVPVIDITKDENKCIYCGKTFANGYSLKRHAPTCRVKDRHIMQLLLERQEEDRKNMDRMLNVLEKLGDQKATLLVNNTNIQQNLYMNVTFCSFGNEDFKKLDSEKVMALLRGQVKDFMSKMIEYLHTDPNHPEFHNIFYDPMRKKAIVFMRISEHEMGWQTRDFREMSDILTDQIRDHVAPGNGPYFDMAMKEKDYDTSNNIINIAKHINWKTDESVEMNQNSLSKLAKNSEFMNRVQEISE